MWPSKCGRCVVTGSSEGAEGAASAAASPSTSPAQAGLAEEQAPHTGEEGETVLYDAEGTLFQFDDQETKTWRERGRGELRVNKAPNGGSSCCPECLPACLALPAKIWSANTNKHQGEIALRACVCTAALLGCHSVHVLYACRTRQCFQKDINHTSADPDLGLLLHMQ